MYKYVKKIILRTERDNLEQKCLEELRNYPESSQETQTNDEDFLAKPDFQTLPTTDTLIKQVKEIERMIRVHSQRFVGEKLLILLHFLKLFDYFKISKVHF